MLTAEISLATVERYGLWWPFKWSCNIDTFAGERGVVEDDEIFGDKMERQKDTRL